MTITIEIIAGYLVVGMLFLIVFNSRTRRVEGNLDDVVTEAQAKIVNVSSTFNSIAGPAGQMSPLVMGKKTTIVVLLLVAWATWPLVLIGYLRSRRGDKNEK